MLAHLGARAVYIASIAGSASVAEAPARHEFIIRELLPILQGIVFEDLGLSCTLEDAAASGNL